MREPFTPHRWDSNQCRRVYTDGDESRADPEQVPEHYRLISQPARVMRALSHPPDLTRRILSADSIYTRSNPNLISFKSTARR